jgi:hypothetical protein
MHCLHSNLEESSFYNAEQQLDVIKDVLLQCEACIRCWTPPTPSLKVGFALGCWLKLYSAQVTQVAQWYNDDTVII